MNDLADSRLFVGPSIGRGLLVHCVIDVGNGEFTSIACVSPYVLSSVYPPPSGSGREYDGLRGVEAALKGLKRSLKTSVSSGRVRKGLKRA